MPKKPNAHGMQEYVPAGNGDASGEYADGEGKNKGFKAFKKPTEEEHKSKEMERQREAKAEHFRKLGAKVSDDGIVTLYHATLPENIRKIEEQGFEGSNAPINGGFVGALKPRSFFGYDKEWVKKAWSSGGKRQIMEVRIPAEYLHQVGGNTQEVFVEGKIKKQENVWIPEEAPTSTAWDRIRVKKYFANQNL